MSNRVSKFWASFWNALDWTILCGLVVAAIVGGLTSATAALGDPLFTILGVVQAAMVVLCVIAVAVPLLALTSWLVPAKIESGEAGSFEKRD